MKTDGLGTFLAYQALVDATYTPLLGDAPDVNTWCAAGPGTLAGLNRLHGRPVKTRSPRRRRCANCSRSLPSSASNFPTSR